MARVTRSSPDCRRLRVVRLTNHRRWRKRMQQSDLAFINDIRAASELRTPRTSSALLVSVIALMAAGVIWAHFAELDEVKRGNGRVVRASPTSRQRSVRNPRRI